MDVTITRCRRDDVDELVRFIDAHWARGHALVASRRLLDWQHRTTDGGYSFTLARRGREIVGMLGFISTRRFDPALERDNVVWLTMWTIRDDANVAGLGLALLRNLAAQEPHVAIGAVGLNPETRPIYQALGYNVGELQHYVMPNVRLTRFELASFASVAQARESDVASAPLTRRSLDDPRAFDRLDGARLLRSAGEIPQKTVRYFHDRYVAHPVYSYRVIGLFDREMLAGLVAARVAEHGGRRAVRIVDFLGRTETVAHIGRVARALIDETDAEYADVYNTGIDESAFRAAGFRRVDPDGADIVPDHFEPFERRNVRLWYAIDSECRPILFKGDADQDRPNLVANEQR
jgi:hypothetical protein